jgi:hypothetical protein
MLQSQDQIVEELASARRGILKLMGRLMGITVNRKLQKLKEG